MTTFNTRIVLQQATAQDWQALQSAFIQQLPSVQVTEKKLTIPESIAHEYIVKGDIGVQEITRAAQEAALETGKEYSFTIIKSKSAL